MARSNRINVRLRNALSFHSPALAQLFEDESLPRATVHPSGVTVGFRWRLDLRLAGQTLLRLGLTDAVLSDLGCNDQLIERSGAEVAAALLAPVLRRLRTWVHGVPEPAVVADREGRIEMGAGALFRLQVTGRTGPHSLPGQMSENVAARILDCLDERRRPISRHVPLPVYIGRQIRLPVREFIALAPGDVILHGHRQRAAVVDLLVAQHDRAETFTPVARLDRSSGRLLGLARADGHRGIDARGPLVRVDIVEGMGIATSTAIRRLEPAMRPRFWTKCQWLEQSELRVSGRIVGWARPTHIAGCPGHEITAIGI
jgi:hypothetical protein